MSAKLESSLLVVCYRCEIRPLLLSFWRSWKMRWVFHLVHFVWTSCLASSNSVFTTSGLLSSMLTVKLWNSLADCISDCSRRPPFPSQAFTKIRYPDYWSTLWPRSSFNYSCLGFRWVLWGYIRVKNWSICCYCDIFLIWIFNSSLTPNYHTIFCHNLIMNWFIKITHSLNHSIN